MNHFSFKEFTRESVIPLHVADAILKHHMPALNRVRNEIYGPIYISEHSGFRSVPYERSQGRSGTSQHTFRNSDGTPCLGAVDVTTVPFKLEELGYLLTKHTGYTRICWYPESGFYHCDYKDTDHRLFTMGEHGWTRDDTWA